MSEQVVVKSVSGGKPWNDLTFYDVVFDRNGSDFACSWGKKSEGAPQPGEQLEGEFYKDKRDEWKFRKASKPAGMLGAKGDAKFTIPGREWQPESQRDPERSARILRQHSQSAAIQILTGTGSFTDPHATPERIQRWLTEWADWFDQDVIQAAKQGADKSEGATTLVSPSPASRTAPGSGTSAQAGDAHPGPEQNDDTQQWLTKLLEDAALNPDAARTLASFVATRFKPDQIKKAETGLQDQQTMPEAVEKLEQAFRLTMGETLPSYDPVADSIPF